MFDEVIVAMDADEAALDAPAVRKTLASQIAALTLAGSEADAPDGAELARVDPAPARDTQPPTRLLSLSDGSGGAQLPFVVVSASSPRAVAQARAVYAGRTSRLETIGVGYDDSLAGEQALEAACRLAEGRHGKLPRLEAVQPRPAHDPFDAPNAIDQRLAAGPRSLAALGGVEPHAEHGARAEELARFGASGDLLVSGPRDQDGESALHLAPLALRLAHHAPCPDHVVAKPMPVGSDDR